MTEEISLIAFASAFVLLLLAVWQSHRARPPGQLPLIPWTGVQFVALTVCVLLLAHLVSLWTGKPLVGRAG